MVSESKILTPKQSNDSNEGCKLFRHTAMKIDLLQNYFCVKKRNIGFKNARSSTKTARNFELKLRQKRKR